jgi:hypothetical protein
MSHAKLAGASAEFDEDGIPPANPEASVHVTTSVTLDPAFAGQAPMNLGGVLSLAAASSVHHHVRIDRRSEKVAKGIEEGTMTVDLSTAFLTKAVMHNAAVIPVSGGSGGHGATAVYLCTFMAGGSGIPATPAWPTRMSTAGVEPHPCHFVVATGEGALDFRPVSVLQDLAFVGTPEFQEAMQTSEVAMFPASNSMELVFKAGNPYMSVWTCSTRAARRFVKMASTLAPDITVSQERAGGEAKLSVKKSDFDRLKDLAVKAAHDRRSFHLDKPISLQVKIQDQKTGEVRQAPAGTRVSISLELKMAFCDWNTTVPLDE